MAKAERVQDALKPQPATLSSYKVFVKATPVSMSVVGLKIQDVQTTDEARTNALQTVLREVICDEKGEAYDNIDEIMADLTDADAGIVLNLAKNPYSGAGEGN